MKTRILVALILMLFLSSSVVSATKIQKDDTWIYEDKDKVKYDESALDIVQLNDHGIPVSTVMIQTNRGYTFDPAVDLPQYNFTSSLAISTNFLYITQEGGIPYIPVNYTVTGDIMIDNVSIDLSNYTSYFAYSGDPSIGFTTTSSVVYYIFFMIRDDSKDFYYAVDHEYLISSNSNNNDKVKNYTISLVDTTYQFRNGTGDSAQWFEYSTSDVLGLRAIEMTMMLSYEDGVTQPVYIIQTEPVNIRGISLSQYPIFTEYFLIRPEVITSNRLPIQMSIFSLFVIILIYRKNITRVPKE